MIQYDKDGVTVYYTDASGNKVSATPFDGATYSAMLTVMDAQIAAASANTLAVANYNTALANAQTSVNAGRGDTVTAPPKPLETVVSDTGVTTYVPFNPPLADLVPLEVSAPSTGTVPVAPTVDTQAIMYAMLTAIYRKMFPAS
jgi:hypothetical protein